MWSKKVVEVEVLKILIFKEDIVKEFFSVSWEFYILFYVYGICEYLRVYCLEEFEKV